MKRILYIGLLIVVVLMGCNKRECDFLSPIDSQDAEYTELIDSVEAIYVGNKYYDFTDSLVSPALAFYEKGDRSRDYWMQARCHYLAGGLVFDKNHFSEEATVHFLEALKILDSHFDAKQAPVGRLYSKICYILSRIAFNFSDKLCSTRFARYGLDCASVVGDTAWMLRSMANLGLLYERFGKAGEGDTAFFYCHKGLHLANADRFPYETALLENSLANCLRHSHEYDSAIFYFEHSFALVDSSCLLFHRNAIEKAYVHYKAHDYATALADSKVAYQSKDENLKAQAAYCLVDCYEALGDTLSTLPFYAFLKTSEEKDVVASNHNAKALPMLNAYLSDKQRLEHRVGIVWVAIIVGLLALTAVVVLAKQKGRKMLKQQQAEAERALKAKDSQHELELKAKQDEALRQLEAARQSHEEEVKRLQATVEQSSQHQRDMLQQRVLAIYQTGGEDRLQRILDEFESAYPSATVRLQQACPNLNETECRIVILSFLGFRAKEAANLLGLKENTVTQYRSNLKKKADIDGLFTSIG